MPPSLSQPPAATPADALARLERLQAERLAMAGAGVDPACAHVAHLEAAIASAHAAFVTSAVVEIAALRAGFDGPLHG